MGLFSKKDPLANGPNLTPVEYLCKLQEETNSLLRELLVAHTGNYAKTPRTRVQAPSRTFTDKDVTVVTRAMRIQQEQTRQTQTAAPWRTFVSGPASETTSPKDGSMPSAANGDASRAVGVPTPDGPL